MKCPDANLMRYVSKMSGSMLDSGTMVDSAKSRVLKGAVSRRAFVLTSLCAVLVGTSKPAHAQLRRRRKGRRIRRRALRRFRRRGGRIEGRARDAIQQGDIRPLREVMAKVRARSDAEVLDVDLHERPRGWVYALRILTPQGRVRDVFLDASSLKVLHLGKREGVGTNDDGIPLPRELSQPEAPARPTPIPKTVPPAPSPKPK